MPRCGASFGPDKTAVNHKRQSICTKIGHAVPFDGAEFIYKLKKILLRLSFKTPLHLCNERALARGRKWCDQEEELSGLALFLQSGRRYKSVR